MYMGGYFRHEILTCRWSLELRSLCGTFSRRREAELGRCLQVRTRRRVKGGTPRGLWTIEPCAQFWSLERIQEEVWRRRCPGRCWGFTSVGKARDDIRISTCYCREASARLHAYSQSVSFASRLYLWPSPGSQATCRISTSRAKRQPHERNMP